MKTRECVPDVLSLLAKLKQRIYQIKTTQDDIKLFVQLFFLVLDLYGLNCLGRQVLPCLIKQEMAKLSINLHSSDQT